MTGFGRAQASAGAFQVTVEVRSVNHRFADFKLRLPTDLAVLEKPMHDRLKKSVRRGRLDVNVSVSRGEGRARPVEINVPLVEAYVRAARRIMKQHRIGGEIGIDTVLGLPDVLRPVTIEGVPSRAERAAVLRAFDTALAAHDAMRVREGRILGRDLLRRFTRIGRLHGRIAKRAPEMLPEYARRLGARIAALNGREGIGVDPGRLAQEVAVASEKADITEELVRLSGYLEQTRELMTDAAEPVGKKLDFILQEMNREANTINSKAIDLAVCQDALEVKAEVEKIREQVQNIE